MRDKRTMYLIWKKKWTNFCLQITATSFRYGISRSSLLTKAFCHFSLGIVAVSLGKSSEMENLAFLNFIQFFKIFFLSLQYENWATIGRNLFLFLFSVRCANSMLHLHWISRSASFTSVSIAHGGFVIWITCSASCIRFISPSF